MAIRALETIKNWFKRGDYPTETQFGDTLDSFWHKEQAIPQSSIENFNETMTAKADKEYVDNIFGRRNMTEMATGEDEQRIDYSSTYFNVRPVINDYGGAGITLVSWDADGFVINSKENRPFSWETKINI